MTTSLPQADWTKRTDLAQLIAALGADKARYVGGAVRDTFLGKDIHDVDVATPLLPAEVIDSCREAGIRTVPTGIDHGTVTAILPQGPVEITTLRRDISTDGRRATVAFASKWQDDAARRDFTINALYAHPATLEISDFFGGLDDLARHHVRFIGNAVERIREDHLRILRYFRFQARFGDALDEEAVTACRELAHTLKGLSRERVAMELLAILALPDPAPTIDLMRELGVLAVILPESQDREGRCLAQLVLAEAREDVPGDAVRRLAALLPPIESVAESVAARLRLSKQQRSRLACAARRTSADEASPRALAYFEGSESAIDRLLLQDASAAQLLGWETPELPLKGGEIVDRGIAKGPEVARILRAVERSWVEEGFPDRERVLALLDAELARI